MDVRAAFRSCLLVIGTMSKRLPAAGRALFLSARGWVLCALLVIAALVVYYVLSDRYTPFTTDAFVQAFVIQVTARVEGQVVRVDVQENQPVKKGDLLFEIDPRPFEHRVAVLEAKLVESLGKPTPARSRSRRLRSAGSKPPRSGSIWTQSRSIGWPGPTVNAAGP
ncbi:MAG: biotin/lipoyl-binding protein [Deltaproteobacteria bacterium]|nr:MAG: biotin/lipoyl-binding protein [Deltaproteobacteria bacterium]